MKGRSQPTAVTSLGFTGWGEGLAGGLANCGCKAQTPLPSSVALGPWQLAYLSLEGHEPVQVGPELVGIGLHR